MPDDFLNATFPLALESNVYAFALDEELIDAIGFRPLQVHETLYAGNPANHLTLFRGGIDLDALPDAWRRSGYFEEAGAGGATIWTLGKDGEADLDDPIQRRVIGQLNNVAIVDGVLAYGSTFEIVEQALATRAAGTASAAADFRIAPAVGLLPANTVSALGLHMAGLAIDPHLEAGELDEVEQAFTESDAAVGPMPMHQGSALGITEGLSVSPSDPERATPEAPDTAHGEGLVEIRITCDSATDAELAARVVAYRWEAWTSIQHRLPYADLMRLTSAGVEEKVATFSFIPLRSPAVWRELATDGGLTPLLPNPGL
jgi:hypothetical protein